MSAVVFGLLLPLGCILGPGGDELPPADSGTYYASVEEELGMSCANPSCHGSVARPFEVYAPHYHRLDGTSTFLDEPLTAEERRLNFDRSRAFLTPANLADSLLLTKSLSVEAGGVPHGEELAIYLDREDPGWLELAAWAGVP